MYMMVVLVQTRCAARRQDRTGRVAGTVTADLTALRSSHSLTHSHYVLPLRASSWSTAIAFIQHPSSQLLRQRSCYGNLIRTLLLLMERQSAPPPLDSLIVTQ